MLENKQDSVCGVCQMMFVNDWTRVAAALGLNAGEHVRVLHAAWKQLDAAIPPAGSLEDYDVANDRAQAALDLMLGAACSYKELLAASPVAQAAYLHTVQMIGYEALYSDVLNHNMAVYHNMAMYRADMEASADKI